MFLLFLAAILNPTISLQVQPINEITIEAITTPIDIPFYPEKVTSKSSYAITTNGNDKKIIGSLDLPLPNNLQVSIHLQAPSGAQSQGHVNLSSQSATLVTGISRIAQGNLSITYTFSSTSPVLSGNYTEIVRLTLTD
jgi:hypothetical protein